MIRITIIDDEQHCAEQIVTLLEDHHDKAIISSIHHEANDALRGIAKHHPDVVFLDVHLGETTAFELLKQLPTIDFALIFTTAYERYAIQAFQYAALDYLLKPISKDEFARAISRAITLTEKIHSAERVRLLLGNLSLEGKRKKISIPTGDGLIFLNISEIVRCEADVNYTHIYTISGHKHTVAKTLKYFDELLADNNFFRVHQSHLINLDHIRKYQRTKSGTVIMADNTSIDVSTRRRELFLEKINAL
ncbi:LytR/AlgR family response regulator transcription factor [Mucilaginibacter celer]|uniref:Response regulator n=1 Tax=Mucilaginibacter celer TaxID=2305508 RepID=A0A494VXA6_9SPHI|nr:LytTR family DNA-binding domain-containing protein [Mucilaginibacter celer]AYL95622.1 response regulator [Mucilaginibacter celer]